MQEGKNKLFKCVLQNKTEQPETIKSNQKITTMYSPPKKNGVHGGKQTG